MTRKLFELDNFSIYWDDHCDLLEDFPESSFQVRLAHRLTLN